MNRSLVNIFFILILLASCLSEEGMDTRYPLITTNAVSDITSLGARFSSVFEFKNPEQIKEFGFIWGTDPGLQNNTYSVKVDSIISKGFSVEIRSTLVDKQMYYVRAYCKTTKTIYGNIVSFRSLGSEGPKITSLSKALAAIGDTITVTGRNFSGADPKLYYGSVDITGSIVNIAPTRILFVLPVSVQLYPLERYVKVSIEGNSSNSPKTLAIDVDGSAPVIISISPRIVKACDTVTLIGTRLKLDETVSVGTNVSVMTILHSSRDTLICIIKNLPNDDLVFIVWNGILSGESKGITMQKENAEILSLSSNVYLPGDTISLAIKNFPLCYSLPVRAYANEQTPLIILSITESTVKVKLPSSCLGSFNIAFGFVSPWDYRFTAFCTSPLLSPLIPEIYSVVPNHASLNDEVVIKGKNLGPYDVSFMDVISSSHSEIRGKVHEIYAAPSGLIDVEVGGCDDVHYLQNGFTYDPPVINSVPAVTSPTQTIEIKGKNFSEGPYYSNTVTLGNGMTFDNINASNQTIIIPGNAVISDGSVTLHKTVSVTVSNGTGMESQPVNITVDHDATWFKLNDFSFPLVNGVSFSIGNKGYAGIGISNIKGVNLSFWEFDPPTTTWTKKSNFPGTYSGNDTPVGVTAGNKGYVMADFSKALWEFDPISNVWTRKQDYPGTIAGSRFGFAIDDKIYVGGGEYYSDFIDDFWEYDTKNDTWTQKASMPLSYSYTGGGTHFAFKGNGYFYSPNDGSMATIENRYDPTSDIWSQRTVSSFFDYDAKSIVFDDFVIVCGAIDYSIPNFHNAIYKFVPGVSNPVQVDFPGNTTSRASGFRIGNYGYFGLGQYEGFWKFDPFKF